MVLFQQLLTYTYTDKLKNTNWPKNAFHCYVIIKEQGHKTQCYLVLTEMHFGEPWPPATVQSCSSFGGYEE